MPSFNFFNIPEGFCMPVTDKAREGDIPGILSLLKQVLEVHYQLRPDLFIRSTTKYESDELLKIISDPMTPVFVCRSDASAQSPEGGKVLGHAFCQLMDFSGSKNMTPIKTLYIDDICVDEGARGEGVATLLYNHVKEYARQLGCYNITLNVWEGNAPARAFYEAMGMNVQKTVMEAVLQPEPSAER